MNRLFVYGTLLPGQANWHVLEPFVIGEGTPDTARGTMFDTRLGWPCVTFGPAGRGVVVGRVFTIRTDGLADALTEAWAVLDEFEGIHEGDYTRVRIRTVGGVDAWAYQAATPYPHLIESGDWAAHVISIAPPDA